MRTRIFLWIVAATCGTHVAVFGNTARAADFGTVTYEELKANGVEFHQPPHDEPWERSMTAYDPDGYAAEFEQGKRGKNQTSAAGIGEVLDAET